VSGRVEIRVPSRPVLSHAADAVRAGGRVFVAGILPVDAGGELVADDAAAQAERVFADLAEILAASGCTTADVAKLNVFLTDAADRDAVEPVQRRALAGCRPAGTLVEVPALAVPGARIEVDCVAVVP
jgi:enamine deaminase RidA (YjgF/YER057c/UK114 family)